VDLVMRYASVNRIRQTVTLFQFLD
jgi:hypothetical protein